MSFDTKGFDTKRCKPWMHQLLVDSGRYRLGKDKVNRKKLADDLGALGFGPELSTLRNQIGLSSQGAPSFRLIAGVGWVVYVHRAWEFANTPGVDQQRADEVLNKATSMYGDYLVKMVLVSLGVLDTPTGAGQ